MSQEWSRVVSAEDKKEYMTLQGIQTHCSQNTKTVKSHLSLALMRVKLVHFTFIPCAIFVGVKTIYTTKSLFFGTPIIYMKG